MQVVGSSEHCSALDGLARLINYATEDNPAFANDYVGVPRRLPGPNKNGTRRVAGRRLTIKCGEKPGSLYSQPIAARGYVYFVNSIRSCRRARLHAGGCDNDTRPGDRPPSGCHDSTTNDALGNCHTARLLSAPASAHQQ